MARFNAVRQRTVLGRWDHATARQVMRRGKAFVTTRANQRIDCQGGPHGEGILRQRGRGRHDERQRRDKARRDAGEGAPLANRLAHPGDVGGLQIAQPAVDGLEMIEGGRGAEVAALDQRHRQPALRGVVRGREAIDAAADDEQVEFGGGQAREISIHARISYSRRRCRSVHLHAPPSAPSASTGKRTSTISKSRGIRPGSPGFFADLEQYHFEKLHHLPRLIPFDRYRGRRVLEVGCGAGTDLIRFARNGAVVTGVDMAASAITLASRNFAIEGRKAELLVADGEALPFGERPSTWSTRTASCNTPPTTARWCGNAAAC